MSELRQRRGEPTEVDGKEAEIAALRAELAAIRSQKEEQPALQAVRGSAPLTEEEEKSKFAQEIARTLEESKPKPAKGLSKQAKECKSRLDADPFNMKYIFELGLVYAEDVQWDRCLNVLLRGWKRVNELEVAAARYGLLTCLAQASLKMEKFRQALAVMNDIEEPTEDEQRHHFQELRCRIFSENGDLQKALQAWSKAIEGRTFEEAIGVWSNCLVSLKKAGALEVTRSKLAELAGTEDDLAKIEAVEKLVYLREDIYANDGSEEAAARTRVAKIVAAAGFVVFLVILTVFESYSFSQMGSRGGS